MNGAVATSQRRIVPLKPDKVKFDGEEPEQIVVLPLITPPTVGEETFITTKLEVTVDTIAHGRLEVS